MKRSLKRSAFSLLELLAVVVILGIIAAVVIPRVTTSADKAKTEVNNFNIATLNSAVERYYVDNGTWPASLSAMGTDYLPDGVPESPLPSTTYTLNGTTHRVETQTSS